VTSLPHVFDAARLDPKSPDYAAEFVDRLLGAALRARASDIHLHPVPTGLEVRWRIDGVLRPLGTFSRGEGADVVTRLKVLAQLLTYFAEVPQEGRLRDGPGGVEIRVSTFPTLHGERAAVRLFAARSGLTYPADLGLPDDVLAAFRAALEETSGALIVAGPAGSGKTTTAYAALRELVRSGGGAKSVVTLEDPIEAAIDGVSQSQVKPTAGFSLASGLRSLLRQDPEVLLVGEIRDRDTAEGVLQASLTGHLVISTFHAGSVAETAGRLLEMGLEPYLLRSGLQALLCQRLLRKLCGCKRPAQTDDDLLGLPVPGEQTFLPGECAECLGSGYQGRLPIAELLSCSTGAAREVLSRADTSALEAAAARAGMVPLQQRAHALVAAGVTSPAEVRRVLGFRKE
jgi:general secretion pathway protein E